MKKVKWGVIGAGGIADRRTIPGMMLAENAELVAVMDISGELAESIRAKYGANRAYTSDDDLLADPGVEAVYIASPVFYHREQAIKAAQAGKHILLEKPVALTRDDGLQVLAACRNNGILAASGLMMRYHPYHQRMKQIIGGGKLGQVVSCRAQLTCWYPDMPGAWRQKKDLAGGGAMMDMGVHCVDLIQFVTGSKANRVIGMVGTKTFGYEVEDSASVLFELENGAYCTVDANFNIPDAAARCRFEVYGTRGSILAEGTISQVEGGKLEVMLADENLAYDAQQDRVDVAPMPVEVDFGNMYAKEIESFGDSITKGTPVLVPLEDALQVQRVVEAAYRSTYTGAFTFLDT